MGRAGRCFWWHVSIPGDAHSFDLGDGRAGVFWRDQAGDLSESLDHARHDHGFLRADHGAAGWVRKLLPADSDWGAGHGVSGAEYAFVLDHLPRLHRAACGVLCNRRRTASWMDWLCAAE